MKASQFALFLNWLLITPQLHSYTVFYSDAWPYIFGALLSFTSGYYCTICLMYGPSLVQPSQAELAGTTMVWYGMVRYTASSLVHSLAGCHAECGYSTRHDLVIWCQGRALSVQSVLMVNKALLFTIPPSSPGHRMTTLTPTTRQSPIPGHARLAADRARVCLWERYLEHSQLFSLQF